MQKLEIVLGLIEQGDEYILQLRDMNDPNAITAGLIGCFGGKQQPDETPRAAVARELSEETSLTARPDEWQLLGKVEVSSEYLLELRDVFGDSLSICVASRRRCSSQRRRDCPLAAHCGCRP